MTRRPDDLIETKLIHAGEPRPRVMGAVTLPVFQSSTYEYGGQKDYHNLRYIRLNNTPNHTALHDKLAALENAEAAVVMGSGMAAISTALLSFLSAGDHLLAQSCLYGGTRDFFAKDLPALGVSFDFVDADDPGSWEAKVRPTTRLLYVETLSNPLLEVGHLEAAADFARRHSLLSVIDNTFATPVNFRPAERGFDLSLHSATKYLNGHSDIVAGAVIGKTELVDKVKRKLDHFGGSLDPHAAFLLHRGLKTLALRVRYQNESAMAIAGFLSRHPKVKRVNYPGLKSHPNHQRARRLLTGFGGMLSFELKGGLPAARRLLGQLRLPIVAPSLGGVESLITLPSTTSHAGMSKAEREQLGITDGLVRLSVGIEATEDLIADFRFALA